MHTGSRCEYMYRFLACISYVSVCWLLYLQILETAHKLGEQEWEYSMEASFIEIYNNMLRDLLAGGSSYINDQNAIKHDPSGGHTIVAGVSKVRDILSSPWLHWEDLQWS